MTSAFHWIKCKRAIFLMPAVHCTVSKNLILRWHPLSSRIFSFKIASCANNCIHVRLIDTPITGNYHSALISAYRCTLRFKIDYCKGIHSISKMENMQLITLANTRNNLWNYCFNLLKEETNNKSQLFIA